MGYAVAFPDVAVKGDLRLDAPRELVLDASDVGDLRVWVERAFAYLRGQSGDDAPLGHAGVQELLALLGPTWDLRPVMSAQIEEEQEEQLRLTEEQFAMLDFLGRHRRVAISGCAGSGKTTLAVEKAGRLAREGFDVLLTCFNTNLAEYLAGDESLPEGLDVTNVHRLASNLAKEAGLVQPGPYDDSYFDEILPDLMMQAVDQLGAPYDAVIVDEGQDIHENWWVALQYLLRDQEHGIYYVFFDDNQNLYRSAQKILLELAPFPLTRNCRNTQHIHATVTHFYRSDQMPHVQGPPGRPVEVHEYVDSASLKRALSRTLHQLTVEEGVSPLDIVVLTPKSRQRSELWRLGPVGGLRLTDQWSTSEGKV